MGMMKMIEHPIVKGKLVCVALNDQSQFDAMQDAFNEAPYKKAPTEPVLYFKPRNTWNGDNAILTPPTSDDRFVVGASLAVVIGKKCCRVAENDALNYIRGYSIIHDISLPEESYYRPDIKGKCLDGTAPVAEKMVVANIVSDLTSLKVITKINGEKKALLNLKNLYHSIPQLIEKISRIMTLNEGDVLAVGFIGERIALNTGDEVISTIEGIGSLTTFIGEA